MTINKRVYAEMFRLLDYPKVEGPIPYESDVVHIFSAEQFSEALKWLGSIKLKSESATKVRRVYWDSDRDYIALCVLNKRDVDEK